MSEPYACWMIDHWCICRWYGNMCPLYALCHTELNVFDWARQGDFGKTVFLTRAEAEAAQAGEEDRA
jgi:hypothetical protein